MLLSLFLLIDLYSFYPRMIAAGIIVDRWRSDASLSFSQFKSGALLSVVSIWIQLFGFVTLHTLCITNSYTLHTKCQYFLDTVQPRGRGWLDEMPRSRTRRLRPPNTYQISSLLSITTTSTMKKQDRARRSREWPRSHLSWTTILPWKMSWYVCSINSY